MSKYSGPERRQYGRLNADYIVNYRRKSILKGYDITHTKNIGQGGVLITTSDKFESGDVLVITVRLPFLKRNLEVSCRVVGSLEIIAGLVYDTRLAFVDLPDEIFQKIGEYIDNYK